MAGTEAGSIGIQDKGECDAVGDSHEQASKSESACLQAESQVGAAPLAPKETSTIPTDSSSLPALSSDAPKVQNDAKISEDHSEAAEPPQAVAALANLATPNEGTQSVPMELVDGETTSPAELVTPHQTGASAALRLEPVDESNSASENVPMDVDTLGVTAASDNGGKEATVESMAQDSKEGSATETSVAASPLPSPAPEHAAATQDGEDAAARASSPSKGAAEAPSATAAGAEAEPGASAAEQPLHEAIVALQKEIEAVGKKGLFPQQASKFANEDIKVYLNHYKDVWGLDSTRNSDNIRFYSNEIKSVPDGDYIDDIHKTWLGDYSRLEHHHGYIQWLFPIHEDGMNSDAQMLMRHEADFLRTNQKAQERLKRSYALMLDFYGFQLAENGAVTRSQKWKSRNLMDCTHNFLRITRILKGLGEYGLEHWKAFLLSAFLREIIVTKELSGGVATSCANYWVPTLRVQKDREAMQAIIKKFAKKPESSVFEFRRKRSSEG